MPCYSPLKGWKDPENGGITFRRDAAVWEEMEVSCGQCLGCRLDHARMWAVRISHEARLHEDDNGNSFITLTYSDENMPGDWSLKKKDFQDFMKRLRKAYPQKIRYFHAGEYGNICKHRLMVNICPWCNVGRPHYHAILFNITFDDLEPVGRKKDHIHYTSKRLAKIWQKGHVQVGTVTYQSAGYVARYCMKKINGVNKDEHYKSLDPTTGEITYVQQEYCTMSRRPGIGKEWYERFKGDLFPRDETPFLDGGETKVVRGVPRYYENLAKEEEPEMVELVKRIRQEFREANADEYSADRLMQKYKVKLASTQTLKRDI